MDNNFSVKATIKLEYSVELYKLVDFLNKNLKTKNLIFGLSKKDEATAIISIYETD